MTTIKVKELLNADLVGEKVPDKTNGNAGRAVENKLRERGLTINRKGTDITFGGDISSVEVKSRDIDAISPHTIGGMTTEEIINTPWLFSSIREKSLSQFRVKSKDNIIVSNEIFDFDKPYIQDLLEKAYEDCRNKIINGNRDPYINSKISGIYFENQTEYDRYCFRMSDAKMKKIENTSKSEYDKFFTET
jgi:hypothetical protein